MTNGNFRGHCHSTGNYRGPAQEKGNINVTQKQSIFIPLAIHNFSNFECHLFFKSLVNEWEIKVGTDIIPETNEKYIPETYGFSSCFER